MPPARPGVASRHGPRSAFCAGSRERGNPHGHGAAATNRAVAGARLPCSPRRMRAPAALLYACALLGACRTSAPYTIPSAAVNTALAVGFAAHERAQGGCYASCTGGTSCNPKTGYCEPAPCGGSCHEWETCVEEGLVWRCTASVPTVSARRPAGEAKPGDV